MVILESETMKLLNQARKYGAKIAVASSGLMFAALSHADGITDSLDAVDLSGIATKVGAAGLAIIAVALVFKGPDLAKRVIRKV